MKLSILICHLTKRKPLLDRLMACLQPQLTPEVEVLVEEDQGQLTIGAKRNILLGKATAEYIAFFDDDDTPSESYIAKILKALESKPDAVGFMGNIFQDFTNRPRPFIHSIQYKEWYESGPTFYRGINHLNPVRRELALQAGFPSTSSEEDRRYSERLAPLLKTEVFIEGEPIYNYYAY